MNSVTAVPKPMIDRLYHLPYIARHYHYYLRLNTHILSRGVPLDELLVLKYPFQMRDAARPPLLSVDITDDCDLKCVYCNNPLFPDRRSMMSDECFDALVANLQSSSFNRIRIGGGEPTLHPKIDLMMKRLSGCTKYLSIVTNGQWRDHRMEERLLSCGLNLIEISVDGGGAKVYEASRKNASYKLLLENLRGLRRLRDQKRSKTLIKIRLMLRPSTQYLEKQETLFLQHYADIVMPQWLLKHPESDYAEDVFIQESVVENRIPRCTVLFRDLQVRPDGMIPLCPAKGCSIKPQDRIFIGDLRHDSLVDLWNCPQMREMRDAHRYRRVEKLALCQNCHYG
ncbi:MAG: radical SAM protein [Candidatus Cloacimonadota bacterium]